jgi:hypothetical protein
VTRRLAVQAAALTALLVALSGCAVSAPQVAGPSSRAAIDEESYGPHMSRDRFYALIDSARSGTDRKTPTADPDALRLALADLSSSEVSDFVLAFDDELIRLNRWSVWGAGYVASGGMSDDGFHYFRSWLIGKGRVAVDAVLKEPDSLADVIDGSDLENEELEYVGLDVLDERGLSDPRDQGTRASADDEPGGEPFDEDTAEETYPRTAASVG